MGRYRKKPVEVEAIQFWPTEECLEVLSKFSDGWLSRGGVYKIETLEGVMTAQPGDWIIKGVQGETYPCRPAIFEQTYEEV